MLPAVCALAVCVCLQHCWLCWNAYTIVLFCSGSAAKLSFLLEVEQLGCTVISRSLAISVIVFLGALVSLVVVEECCMSAICVPASAAAQHTFVYSWHGPSRAALHDEQIFGAAQGLSNG
jgi:hypothetical protein